MKSLKEIEYLYNNMTTSETIRLKPHLEEIEKELKAFEIIKEQLRYFIDYDENTKTIYVDGAIDCDNQEYELLKEVLL